MGRGPEGKIQDKVIRYAREEHNALCVKNEAGMYHVGGFLDYTIYPDKRRKKNAEVFVIEFKAPGKDPVPTPKQAYNMRQLRDRGHTSYVVNDVEQGKKIIDEECA